MTNNSNIYDSCKDLYFNEKEMQKNRLQRIYSANSLNGHLCAKMQMVQQQQVHPMMFNHKDFWKKVWSTFRFWVFLGSRISLRTQTRFDCKA